MLESAIYNGWCSIPTGLWPGDFGQAPVQQPFVTANKPDDTPKAQGVQQSMLRTAMERIMAFRKQKRISTILSMMRYRTAMSR